MQVSDINKHGLKVIFESVSMLESFKTLNKEVSLKKNTNEYKAH